MTDVLIIWQRMLSRAEVLPAQSQRYWDDDLKATIIAYDGALLRVKKL
jgi:hypothetical protein